MKATIHGVLVLLAVLAGCASAPPATVLQTIQIIASVNANQNNATAFDLVFVYDASVHALIPQTSPEWFANRDALTAGLATAIDVVQLQITPASTLTLPSEKYPLPARYGKAIKVYGYANHVAPAGQARLNMTPYGSTSIGLAPDTVTITGAEPKSLVDKLLGVFSSKAPAK